ncbi:MAG: hypothetical protein HHAS10_08720 [Candidatus Altimarinota bacterium]
MKTIAFIIVLSFLTGCSILPLKQGNHRNIVELFAGDMRIGYGLMLESGAYMTATHVLNNCKKLNCYIHGKNIGNRVISLDGDISIIGEDVNLEDVKLAGVISGESLYLLRPENGRMNRYTTKVTGVNIDYIAYDSLLSGSYLTGGIEIGISLQKGDSGLPVWNEGDQLVGVVSSTDVVGGKSYIAQ